MPSRPLVFFVALVAASAQPLTREQALARASALTALGKKIFFDPSLSASGKLACATCHDPAYAYGPPNALAVRPGGIRAVPSLRYLQTIPQFTEHYFGNGDEVNESIDNGPTGGLTWDGRVDRARNQARLPLLSPREMANKDETAVVAEALKTPYAKELKSLSNSSIFETILEALETWQQDPEEFYPYTSKYDAYLKGKAILTDQEAKGLKLFTDPKKGNCAQCHIATRGPNGTPPQFTDYGYAALGLPRNPEIPANKNPNWYDLGLCGPERKDLAGKSKYCGQFITPTLRNVATRRAFFHNGVFHTLREAVAFYANRDKTQPDLPARYRKNLTDLNQKLKPEEIDQIVAFLQTLTDR